MSETPKPTSEEIRRIAAILRILGDRTRLKIAYACLEGPLSVSEIARRAGVSPSLVSHHLRPLRDLRVLRDERAGRQILYSYADDHIRNVLKDFLDHIRELEHGDGL